MYPAQQPLAFQRDEILADRFPGNPESLGDVEDLNASMAAEAVENALFALVGVGSAGISVFGAHDR